MAETIKVLVSEEEVEKRIRDLGEKISKDYEEMCIRDRAYKEREITRQVRSKTCGQERQAIQDFRLPMYFIMNWKMMHGYVYVLPVQSQK